MTQSFAYCGNERFIAAVIDRIEQGGFVRTDDVAAADIIITFCTSQTVLEDLYFDDGGLVQIASPGSLLIDLSAMTPSFAREINAVVTVNDLAMVEAPLVVDDIVAPCAFSRDNLSCFVAGEDQCITRAEQLLSCIFEKVVKTGTPGTAQLVRASRTLQMCAQVVSLMEANALWYASVRSTVEEREKPCVPFQAYSDQAALVLQAIEDARFDGDYTAEMLMAELSAALMAADDAELILPQSEAIMHLLELLAVVGGVDKSPTALALVYGEEAECAKHGLDWTRAEQVYGQQDECSSGEDILDDLEDEAQRNYDGADNDDDYDDYGDLEDPYGGFGYSSN